MDHQSPTSGPASNGGSNGSIAKSCYRTKIKYNNKVNLAKKAQSDLKSLVMGMNFKKPVLKFCMFC